MKCPLDEMKGTVENSSWTKQKPATDKGHSRYEKTYFKIHQNLIEIDVTLADLNYKKTYKKKNRGWFTLIQSP